MVLIHQGCAGSPQVDPGVFREMHTFMQSTTKGRGRVEVVSFAVTAEGATAEEFAASAPTHASSAAAANSHVLTTMPAQPVRPVPMASPAKRAVAPRATAGSGGDGGGSKGEVVYARGPIAGLPEAHASRKERFAELDNLQPGWEVELCSKGDTVEAVFYAPGSGECVGAYANARRMALAASKAAKAAP